MIEDWSNEGVKSYQPPAFEDPLGNHGCIRPVLEDVHIEGELIHGSLYLFSGGHI